jgi:hypothetical protein
MTKVKYTVEHIGTETPRPQIARNGALLSMQVAVAELERLHAALDYAHNAILHEMDNGRTPSLIRLEHGGQGIGLIEDALCGIDRRYDIRPMSHKCTCGGENIIFTHDSEGTLESVHCGDCSLEWDVS